MSITNYVLGAFGGIGMGLWGGVCGGGYTGKLIPVDTKVQSGYVAPSKLEIRCNDLDGNGERETVMKIGDTQYLLREVDGQPVLSQYEVKPAQIVPK